MGERGPVPKRMNKRHGHLTKEQKAGVDQAPAGHANPVEAPAADEGWHPIARQWYESLAESGQARFYEPSDWALAFLLAESISRDLSPQVVGTTDDGEILRDVIPLKGASLSAYLKAMTSLLVTEGDRRRARVELQRGQTVDEDEEAAVVALDEYQRRLGSG